MARIEIKKMLHFSTQMLNEFEEFIYGRSALRFSPSRLINFEMRIRERATAMGFDSLEDYLKILKNCNQEMNVLLDKITTKETHFFRLPGQFEALKSMVIPRIEDSLSQQISNRLASKGELEGWKADLRMWSAGCATGEEVYSIAMTLADALKYKKAWSMELLASDLSMDAVKFAEAGVFEDKSLGKIPEEYRKKYMSDCAGSAAMSGELKKFISFRTFNLQNLMSARDPYPFYKSDGTREIRGLYSQFDIIFCRNVMIYFDIPAQQLLIDGLYQCLKPGGYLFTGDVELLHIYEHQFRTINHEGIYFYQKPEE